MIALEFLNTVKFYRNREIDCIWVWLVGTHFSDLFHIHFINFKSFFSFFLGFIYDSPFISENHTSFLLIWFTLITFTLQKGESPFIYPNSFTLKGASPCSPFIHPSRRVFHPLGWIRSLFRRVNKLVRTFINPSGEWSTLI